MNGSVNTGIAIANPNNQEASIQFYFTGSQGNTGAGTTTIAANAQIANFLDQSPFSAAKPLVGTFTFTSSVPVAAVALRGLTNERGEFLITTLPVADIAATASTEPIAFPHFADGAGWSTQVVLVNPSDSQLTGAVQFYDPAGNGATVTIGGQTASSFNYSIPPRASQTFATLGAAGSVQAGSVRVVKGRTSSTPSGLVIFSLGQSGVTVANAGVTAASGGSAFRLYTEVSGDFARGMPGSIQTGLAISNSSNAAAVVTLELKRLDGSSTGLTATIQVPANGQVSKFIYQIPGLASLQLPFQGLLRISSPTPVSVVGLRSHVNERREILITTTPPANEGTSATNTDLFIPHFADGGGYTTQFILFSGSLGQQSSGVLRLMSQSGSPMNLTLH